MQKTCFTKQSLINAPIEDVFKWHTRAGALERLSPPWEPIEVIEQHGGINKGASVLMKMKAGPFHYRWAAEHTDYHKNRLFKDRQKRGPFASWNHTHTFQDDQSGGCLMQDQIEYALPADPFTRPFVPVIRKKLERIFHYRHTTLAYDLALHQTRRSKPPLNILISGASGLIGSAIIPFFTTGGHSVTRLVRKKTASLNQVSWDPRAGKLEPSQLENRDVVINFSGENIGQGRWSDAKKRIIIESRTRTTALIAETIAGLEKPPKVLINASAIGYYGNQGDLPLTEDAGCGDAFISQVCRDWEKAAAPAQKKGIRVVFLRLGVVLAPGGGALEKMLLPFKMGLGGKFGSGRQYMSFIGIDDVIGSVWHIINHDALEGPVNIVAPRPVTNLEFTQTLGKVLKRPTMFSVPEIAVRSVFGEMGKELLLASTRVEPQKLTASGYKFRNPDLEDVLRHLLGVAK